MTPAFLIFLLSLLAVGGLAAWRGGTDERMGAAALAIAAALTPLVLSHGFAGPEVGVVLVDAGVFIVLMWIAMRSRAFWPMWAAGFQLCNLAGHLAAAKSSAVVPAAYAETLAIWSYAVLATLLVGTLVEGRQHHGRG